MRCIIAQRGVAAPRRRARLRRERGATPGAADREAQIHDQEAAARAVRPILGARRAARSARASACRPGREMPPRPRPRRRWRRPAKITVPAFERRKPARRPLPEHLPRERIVYPAPSACPCCGGGRLRKIGEDVTETLELIPRQWKVIQHVREKFSCRACESDHAAAGALASDRARARRTKAARPYPVLQVRPAPAAQSPERRPMRAKASISTSRRSPTGSARRRQR